MMVCEADQNVSEWVNECGVAAEGDVAVAVTDFQIEKKKDEMR